MNIVEFFKKVETSFNEDNKCGECWSFKAPLSESGLNAVNLKPDETCCVKMIMTYYKYSAGYVKSNITPLQKTGYCDYIFTLYVVKETELGVNVYNEEPDHPIDESLYEEILKPLENCLGCGHEFDLCELGYDFDIFKWEMEPALLLGDYNWVGWKISGIFREYK